MSWLIINFCLFFRERDRTEDLERIILNLDPTDEGYVSDRTYITANQDSAIHLSMKPNKTNYESSCSEGK